MIKTDTKTQYIDAIKDMRRVMLGPCPINVVGMLSYECVPTLLRRWAMSSDPIQADIRVDFQAILRGLDTVINACPGEPWLRVMRGRALTALGWYAGAIEDFEAVIFSAESADSYLFMAEAYFGQAKITLNNKADYYGFAAFRATKSIQFHTKEQKSPRPYLLRAQCDAHIMKLCGYHRSTLPFRAKYLGIKDDLRTARQYAAEMESALVDSIEDNIEALLNA